VTPFGLGAYASRQTYMAGLAIRKTAGILKEKVLKYASFMSGMDVHNLDIVDGKVVEKTLGRTIYTLTEVATEAMYSLKQADHLTAEATNQCKNNALSLGCAFAEVEVDIPLGKVKLLNLINAHDCGTLINPQLAEAQVHGGMSMAIGFGLSEKLLFDQKTGKPLNNNLLDYKLCTTMDHPDLMVHFEENPEPTHPYGVKSLGEPPAIPGAPAIRNAVLNATGVAVDELPLNPHILFKRFVEEGLIEGGK